MKYKVGDKVRIRSDLKIGEEYGGIIFLDEMAKVKGQIVTIKKTNNYEKCYVMKETEFDLWYAEEMVEDVEENIIRNTIDKLLSNPSVIIGELAQKIQKQETLVNELKKEIQELEKTNSFLKGKISVYEKMAEVENDK